jgi:hypothetical protein
MLAVLQLVPVILMRSIVWIVSIGTLRNMVIGCCGRVTQPILQEVVIIGGSNISTAAVMGY